MGELRSLLIEQMQDLLHAEGQLLKALPQMADAANNAALKECFTKHLSQTEGHVDRLNRAFELLGVDAQAKPCKAMKGIVEETQETIEEGRNKDALVADIAIVASAQRVEHYEIAGYGNARTLARLLGEIDVARILTHTLGEEEAADHLLTTASASIVQEAVLNEEEATSKRTGHRKGKKPNLQAVH